MYGYSADVQAKMDAVRQQRDELRKQLVTLREQFYSIRLEDAARIVREKEERFQAILAHGYPLIQIASATQGNYPRKGGSFIIVTANEGFLARIDIEKGGKFDKHGKPIFSMQDGRILGGKPSDLELVQVTVTDQGIQPYDPNDEHEESAGEDDYESDYDEDAWWRDDYELLNY